MAEGVLHEEARRVFKLGKAEGAETPLRLHRHQADAVKTARTGASYVLTTGTGSGKSLAYIVPIVDHVLRRGSGKGIQAIVVYPMNALANSQAGELEKFLRAGYPDGKGPVTFRRYTGQESDDDRREIIANPPDILLTNYVMLELILTRPFERKLVEAARGLQFLVLDELHTYRGRQGADVALLARRVREACEAKALQCVGTSATLAGPGTLDEQRAEVARVAIRSVWRRGEAGGRDQRDTGARDASLAAERPGLRCSAPSSRRRRELDTARRVRRLHRRPAFLLGRDGVRPDGGADERQARACDAAPDLRSRRGGGRARDAHRLGRGGRRHSDPVDADGGIPLPQARDRLSGLRVPAAPVLRPR